MSCKPRFARFLVFEEKRLAVKNQSNISTMCMLRTPDICTLQRGLLCYWKILVDFVHNVCLISSSSSFRVLIGKSGEEQTLRPHTLPQDKIPPKEETSYRSGWHSSAFSLLLTNAENSQIELTQVFMINHHKTQAFPYSSFSFWFIID